METEACPSITKTYEKIGKVLEKFLQPNFKFTNDVYLNQFLTHLVDKNDNGYIWQRNEQLKEQFCQWIIEATNLWDQQKVNPQASILSLALSLASQLSADEYIFVRLNRHNVYEKLVGRSQIKLKDSTVTLGLVNLLCSFLEHKSGLQWVMVTNHCMNMIGLGLKAHNMCIRKKAYQFVIKLLEKTISLNRTFAVNLVQLLIKPLKVVFRRLPNNQDTPLKEVESRELFVFLKPSLAMILEIVETMLKNFNRTIIQLFLEQETSEMIEKYLLLSQNEDFSYELLRIQFIFLFHKMVAKVNGKKEVGHDAWLLFDSKVMLDLISNEMVKNHVRCILKICYYAHNMFCCLAPGIPMLSKEENTIEFQSQVMVLQLLPISAFSLQMRPYEDLVDQMMNDIFRNEYIHRLLKKTVVQSITLCYRFVDSLKRKPDIDDVIFSLQYVVKMKRLLNQERASIVFSCLVYSLTDCITGLTDLTQMPVIELNWSFKFFLYLKTLVDTIVDYVESFDLTWKDCMETIRVMDLAYDFLLYPHWTDDTIILKGLNLLNTAISKCMSPDMALLIYHKEDSKVSQTGTLLYSMCHERSWEIRDSALEVVYTLSLNANTKFPAYTHILLKAEFPHLLINMALEDAKYNVRAKAFKCLQELIQTPEIWDILSNMDRFLENILDVFENETEGIVRKEAAALIYKIFKFQNFPEASLPRLYDVMIHAAIGDLHWEVKYNALDFWFNLWEQHLINQGMIDQSFPSHTFSKEHKKIVALNEPEVRKRIIKVLYQLSNIGCLHVMKCAVQDECNVEVSKKATEFTFNTLKMLKLYKVHYENLDLSEPPSPSILQKSFPYQPFLGPASPASSTTMTAPSPASIGNLGSPQVYCENVDLGEPQSPSTVQKSFPNQPFFEPVSPASSRTMTATSPASIGNLESLQFDSTYFDQLSPLPGPFSPCLDLDLLTLSAPIQSPFSITPNSPLEMKSSPPAYSVDEEDDATSSRMQSESLFSNSLSNPITSNLITTNTTQMKIKTYLAPSEYLKFVYSEIETPATEKAQCLNSLDELDSLLDNILKVADINNVDCS